MLTTNTLIVVTKLYTLVTKLYTLCFKEVEIGMFYNQYLEHNGRATPIFQEIIPVYIPCALHFFSFKFLI